MADVVFSARKPSRWPVFLAVLAVASLPLLYFFAPDEEERAYRDKMRLVGILDDLIRSGHYDAAERALRAFWLDRPDTRYGAYRDYLLARAILGSASREPFPGAAVIDDAWKLLDSARLGDPVDIEGLDALVFAAQKEAVAIMRDARLHERAIGYLEKLGNQRAQDDPELYLETAQVHAHQAAHQTDPGERKKLFKKALAMVEEYRNAVKDKPQEISYFVEKARIHWRRGEQEESHNDFRDMQQMLDEAVGLFPSSPRLAELRLWRGKALSMLGENAAALEDLAAAKEQLEGTLSGVTLAHVANLHQVVILGRTHDPRCEKFAGDDTSAYADVLRLLKGRFYLETGRAGPYEVVLEGLRGLENSRVLDEERVDVEGFYRSLRDIWEDPGTPGEDLEHITKVLDELRRLYPDRLDIWLNAALVYGYAGGRFMEGSRQLARLGHDLEGLETRERAAKLYYAGAQRFVDIARRSDVSPDIVSASFFQAAESFSSGKWHHNAARYYRDYYLYRPNENHEGLYREAVSLYRAGIFETEYVEDRDAIRVFEEYVRVSPAGTIYVPRSYLWLGRIYDTLGRYTDASTSFQLVRHRHHGLTPRAWEWQESLRLEGAANLKRALSLQDAAKEDKTKQAQFSAALREARNTLSLYVDSYIEGQTPRPLGLKALFELARVHMVAGEWTEAEERLRQVLALAPDVKDDPDLPPGWVEDPAEEGEESVFRAHFLLGELLFTTAKFRQAYESFGTAYNRYVARPERLWGLIGQARAAVKLGKPEEAGRLQQRALELFNKNRDIYDRSFDTFGKQYWLDLFRVLEEELQGK